MAPGPSPRPYQDSLMPLLHHRFAKAFTKTIVISYAISIWMGGWSGLFWSWFPLGMVAIRTGLLVITTLLIYLVRASKWHVGRRYTLSPVTTLEKYVPTVQSGLTVLCYGVSAWFYSEIFIWSRSEKAKLQYLDPGRLHERMKLNERSFYLRVLFIMLGLVQAARHIYFDFDRIRYEVKKPQESRGSNLELLNKLAPSATEAATIATTTFLGGSFLYFVFLRNILWSLYHSLASNFVSLAKIQKPTGLAPFVNLVFMFITQGTLLVLLWQYCNLTVDLYMAQQPLKKEKPITTDSKDPNGSLLLGLKSKKDLNQNTAFWELAIITERFEDRRKTIYSEIDRKKAPTHKQIADICLSEVRNIGKRIDFADPYWKPENEAKGSANGAIQLVARISQPLKEGQIAGPGVPPTTRLQRIEATASQIARTHSSPHNAQKSLGRDLLKKGQSKVDEGAKEAQGVWEQYKHTIARSPLGWFFGRTFARNVNLVIFGAPYSHQSKISNAVTALTNLTVFSLREDNCGQFQNVVPEIIRTFMAAINKLEKFVNDSPIPWTDFQALAKPEGERKKVAEVDECIGELKQGLEKIVRAFNEYLENIGLSRAEIQEAKKLVGREMVKVARVR